VVVALVVIHLLAGGRTLALSLPSYGILGIAALFSWWPMRRIEIPRRAAPALAASLIFFGYVIARAIFSPEEYLARKDLYMVLAALIVYLLVALNLTSSELRVRLVFVLLILASAHVAVGVIQSLRGDDMMAFRFLPRLDYGARASGFFGYPNHLAAFLEMALPMGLGIMFWSRWRIWAKITVGYFAAICLAGIVLTGSRGGYVSTLAGLLVFGLLSLLAASKRAPKYSILLVAFGVIIAALLAYSGRWALKENLARRDPTISPTEAMSPRIALWQVAVKQFQLHPVFGAGSGFYLYYGREFKPLGIQTDPEYTHNDYLQFLAEYGTVGAVGFVLFLATHLRGGWKAFHNTISREPQTLGAGSNSLALSAGALSAVAACMVHAVVDFPLHNPAVALVMAFVFGILANPSGEIDADSTELKAGFPLGRPFRLVAPALGIWILVIALPTLPAEIYLERARLILSDWRYMESPEIAKAAEQFARRGTRYDTRNPELYYCLGEALIAQAAMTTDTAEKDRLCSESSLAYLRALSSAPRDSRLLLCLASTLDLLKRFDEAEPLYAEAIRRDPISKYAHWEYGHHFELQHKLDEAEAAYRRSLNLGGGPSAQMGLDRITESRKNQP